MRLTSWKPYVEGSQLGSDVLVRRIDVDLPRRRVFSGRFRAGLGHIDLERGAPWVLRATEDVTTKLASRGNRRQPCVMGDVTSNFASGANLAGLDTVARQSAHCVQASRRRWHWERPA